MKTSVARLIAPAAALVAALLFVPSALAAPAATKLKLTGPSRAPGGNATLTAELTAAGKPLAAKTIALYAGGATPVATGNTAKDGRIAFEVSITAPTPFQASYTPVQRDVAAYAPAKSNTKRVAPSVGITLRAATYLRARKRAVGVPRTAIQIKGTVAAYSPGAGIVIDVFKGTKRVNHRAVGVAAAGSKGTFTYSFKPQRRGVYRIRASEPGGSRTVRVFVVRPSAGSGARGTAVRALQSRLRQLGYVTPVNGYFGGSTARAVLAFRKVNGYARTMNASRAVFKKLARGKGGFRMRYTSAGKHVEFDWSRQVLVLARGARAERILHASSGAAATPTVFGKFRFYSKVPGFNAKGMYYSNFFIGGYAIHGYESVPTFPASHGCIRIPIPSARMVDRWIGLGDPIYVYR